MPSEPGRAVLFLDHAAELGGAERSLLLLMEGLPGLGWQPHLACPPGRLAERAAAAGVRVHPVDFPRLRRSPRAAADLIRSARRIREAARAAGAAVLHANTVRAAFYALAAAPAAGLPWIWHRRDFWLSESEPARKGFDRLGVRLLAAGCARWIAVSHAAAAGLPPGKGTVVHNGIALPAPDPEAGRRTREAWGIPPDAPLVGMAGRLRPWKGAEIFLEAVARVAESRPEARFAVIGGDVFGVDPAYPEFLKERAAALGIGDQTVFPGHVEPVEPALAALDLFVHPGAPEPFGRVVLEAMAQGLPVVGFAHGALPELVLDGQTGVHVPPGDAAGLSGAALGLLGDPGRARAMGEAGRRRAAAEFSAAAAARGVAQVLDGLAGRG